MTDTYYIKKPIKVRAFQVTSQWQEWPFWVKEKVWTVNDSTAATETSDGNRVYTTVGDWVYTTVGDWLIEDINGDLYPCSDDVFKATYDRVEDREFKFKQYIADLLLGDPLPHDPATSMAIELSAQEFGWIEAMLIDIRHMRGVRTVQHTPGVSVSVGTNSRGYLISFFRNEKDA